MTPEITHPILHKDIHGLDVSKEFKAMAKANGYKTLEDVLNYPLHELPFKKISGYRVLKELVDLLTNEGLDYLIKDD